MLLVGSKFARRCVLLSQYNTKFSSLQRQFSQTVENTKLTTNMNKVAIIGSGHMGTGIAQVAAVAGNSVFLSDISQDSLNKSKKRIEGRLLKFGRKLQLQNEMDDNTLRAQVEAVINRIQFTTDAAHAVSSCDLVVEAITETLDIKQNFFQSIDDLAPETAIFVTNTSSIPVCEIAAKVSPSRKSRFGGIHFFNAVVMRLVEVIRISETTDGTFDEMLSWSRYIGKIPVACKDTPGFIVNRLNKTYFAEAIAMVERGDTTFQDVDLAMKFGAGYPYGPFELLDYIGIDVIYYIFRGWEKRFPGDAHKCPPTIIKMFEEGKWGMKTGQGFYKYNSDKMK